MTRTFIRTTALTLSMAASVAIAGSAFAAGYLNESPYEKRRQDQRATAAIAPMPAQANTLAQQPFNAPNNVPAPQLSKLEPPAPLDVPSVASGSKFLIPPPSAGETPTRTLLNTTPPSILAPSKPLYPGRGLSADQIAAYDKKRAEEAVAKIARQALPLPTNVTAPTPVAPAFSQATTMQQPAQQTTQIAQANVPARLPLPAELPSGQMPNFKPYATLETQKEIPIDPRVFNMPERAIPAPLPIRDPQLAPLAIDSEPRSPMQLPVPDTAPSHNAPIITPPEALQLPELDALDIPEPLAPRAVAAPIIEPSVPQPKLTEESKRILSKVPKNLDTPKQKHSHKVKVNRIDPDVQGILDAKNSADDSVQTHESVGVRIQVRQPKFNADHELEKAYNALIGGQTEIAMDIYKGILKQAPSNQSALFGLATTYHRIGNLDNARPLYGKLISINPNHREALNNFLVLVSEEAPEDALRQLEELEAKNPDFSPIPAQMALLLDKMGSPEAARNKMIRAASLSPDNLAYKYNLAVMMDTQQKYSDAAALYRQLVQAGNRGETLPADINDLQERLTFIVSNKL